ncbi:methyltransferase domain-containing protein [Pseudodesulfovibrio sp. F-1]|uniref:Methyltransferase domain-containing protein n=1 Tax=Pseudodesulfovibrio alkaliphilus TaxID=2661613 RepID=A0A7K1KPT6_9BACT|nr:class I SAM-dependent methyltransferase [Pseudodesulfovibrio alkaliphilus]MUM78106.1 methyltransferase domain-containing protein [Pseudodesulfovibrio alkaliphilus]
MECIRDNRWIDVWTRKGAEVEQHNLESLMKADGFDARTGCINVGDWFRQAGLIRDQLRISASDVICEVGCGAGAMLWPFREIGASLYGMDYSKSLIETASKAIPEGVFKTGEASAIPFGDSMFNAVFSHGVFFYFSDLAYARTAMLEILRVMKSDGRAMILDVPDMATMDACESYRRNVVYKGEEYPTSQDGPYRHLYYPRSFFADFAREFEMNISFVECDLPSYPMAEYRFNVTLTY